jgi:signal transduction histidine kinase
MFTLFADLIAFHPDAHRRLAASEEALPNERREAELLEQFIAVLGHDLRNPLASINAAARAVLWSPVSVQGRSFVGLIQNSVARMSGLIDNVLDFARGHLGGGQALHQDDRPLLPMLEQVVAELRGPARPDDRGPL